MTTKTRLTLEEFLRMPDIEERRLELIDGEVYEKMSPRWGHSSLAVELAIALKPFGFVGVEPRAGEKRPDALGKPWQRLEPPFVDVREREEVY